MNPARLRRPVTFWLTWLVVQHSTFAVAAWTSPDPWKLGAYARALDIMSPEWWSVLWAVVAAAAGFALLCRCVAVARFAFTLSIAVQLPWAYSVLFEGVAVSEGWAYVPAAVVWLAPAAASAARLTESLTDPRSQLES